MSAGNDPLEDDLEDEELEKLAADILNLDVRVDAAGVSWKYGDSFSIMKSENDGPSSISAAGMMPAQ